jgi:serine/threonine protein kinase
MNHSHIAQIYGAGATDDGRPYFVMEHVSGVPITDYCDRNQLSTRARLELFVLVCGAFEHAHENGPPGNRAADGPADPTTARDTQGPGETG